MSINIDVISKSAIQALIDVGDFVKESQGHITSITQKSTRNPQSNVDIEAEDLLRAKLLKITPDAGFEVEEGVTCRSSTLNWLIDPIDGTKFYTTNFPTFVSQIALQDGNKTIFSAIYNPIANHLFHAISGRGAYLNSKKIQMSYDGSLAESIVNIEVGKIDKIIAPEFINKIGSNTHRLWILPGILIPYLLTNTIQAHIRFYLNGLNSPYDLEPRWLLIREAGGVVLEHEYKGRKIFIAAHPKLATEIEALLGLDTH